MERLDLNYYYGKEAEQFTFYRMPKALITDPRFKNVSNNAKLLYGLMLDRMSLSAKSGWYDEENRVYIKYAVKSIVEDLNVGKDLASRMLKELESIGLIDIVKRSGISSIIYVKNFISDVKAVEEKDQAQNAPSRNMSLVESEDQSQNTRSLENEPVVNCDQSQNAPTLENGVVVKSDQSQNTPTLNVRPVDISDYSYNEDTGTRKISVVPVAKSATSNNNSSNIELNNNNHIYPSVVQDDVDEMDKINREALAYMEIIKENIEYDALMSDRSWSDREMYEELYGIICDVVCVPKSFVRIGGDNYPYNLVKSKFLKLNSSHLQYVIGCMRNNTTKVTNIRAYLITALYNAPNTMGHYYTAEVNHDIFSGKCIGS